MIDWHGLTSQYVGKGAITGLRRKSNVLSFCNKECQVDRIKVLFLATNRRGRQLQLDREAREIDANIRSSEFRESLENYHALV